MFKKYELPELPYEYDALEPVISKEIMTLHHDKHHKGYVDGANATLEKLDKARSEGNDADQKALLKNLSFNLGGHTMHCLFWKNLAPKGEGGEPEGKLKEALEEQFGSIDQFKKEFEQASNAVEGSGWGALSYCKRSGNLLIMQIEKHNVNMYPQSKLLLVNDVWEHAYYLDYKNVRPDYTKAFWDIVNWKEVGKRFEKVLTCCK